MVVDMLDIGLLPGEIKLLGAGGTLYALKIKINKFFRKLQLDWDLLFQVIFSNYNNYLQKNLLIQFELAFRFSSNFNLTYL